MAAGRSPPHPSFAPQMPPSPQGEGTARQGDRATWDVSSSVGALFGRPRAAKGRPYGDPPPFSLPQSALRLTAPSSEGAKETLPQKSLPLTREVAGRRPDGGRDWAASCVRPPVLGAHIGAPLHGGRGSFRPTWLPPPRGKLSAARLTDEGDHGGHGWFSLCPLIRHLLRKCHLPPCGGKAGRAHAVRPYMAAGRVVLRHCEEGRRPDAAIRIPPGKRRIPTAPPGPRNDGEGERPAPL